MVEREIKLRVRDLRRVRSALRRVGFRVSERRVFEVNEVLDTAEGSLRQGGRLLRLRRAGKAVTLTFKGPQRVGKHKEREEVETGVEDFEAALRVFEGVGFRRVFRYEKFRTEFQRKGEAGKVMLDNTPLGIFIELEGPAYWIDRVATELGYSANDYVTASYGALYFEDCEKKGIRAADMVFAGRAKPAGKTLEKTTLRTLNSIEV